MGIETLAASLHEERDALEDICEPFLIQEGFIQRTPRGRMATRKAYEHFEREYKEPKDTKERENAQKKLF